MFKEALIARSVRVALGGGMVGLAMLSAAAQAQQTVQQGERVEVTGSNIRRVQSETASPVTTITREDLDRSGKSNVAELLQTLSIDNQGSVPATFGNGFAAGGGTALSLRGLGAGATLVLLNGRRVASFPLADDGTKVFTDLNTIPLEAVERIEILKDGGSAVYGSDAIAGVVNIILRKDFNGIVAKAQVGQSLRYGDGRDTQASLMGGFGNLDTDGYNFFADFEYRKKEPISYTNRTDRGRVGKTDLRGDGFSADNFDSTAGGQLAFGTGTIYNGGNSASSSIIGNVALASPTGARLGTYYSRDDLTGAGGFTRTFPGANCTNFTSHAQGDAGGGCLTDASQQYGQVIPKEEQFNFFGRGTVKLNNDITAYVEGNATVNRSSNQTTPTGVAYSQASPTAAFTQNAILGVANPDNPYFGSNARLRYLATDLGPRRTAVDAEFGRILAGVRGTAAGWDFDTAASYSKYRLDERFDGYIQSNVLSAMLDPTAANVAAANATSAAYAALPAGTYYRIGENANLNSAAVYAALSPQIRASADSVEALGDFKASRELFNLPGGPLGIAVGAEIRHEENSLTPVTGTDTAQTLGLGYSAYGLSRNIAATYAEVVAPVIKQVELSAAGRYDHYSDFGGAFNPKVGIKVTPVEWLAIRGTYSRGFRAPNAAEEGGGTSAFSSSTDPVRCALGIQSACSSQSVGVLSTGNKNLQPERSKTFTGGFVLDPTRYTTIAADYFKIVRKNEIVAGTGTNADNVSAGNVTRDPTTVQPGVAGDPGALVNILSPYVNSSKTQVRGVDLDARQALPIGASFGKLSFGVKWTHLFSYAVYDQQGNVSEYAGSHGNCNVTNCVGTPKDRVNADVTYAIADVTTSLLMNYRSSIVNQETTNGSPGCETFVGPADADGNQATNPGNCRIGSFTEFDLTTRWQATRNWEVFGTVTNLFDRKPPYDPTTYGAVNYNPLDYQGAVGRFFSVGARYKF